MKTTETASVLREEIIHALKQIYDPEIPVDIWEMGLIYGLQVSPEGVVEIQMTLTSPNCPVAGSLPQEVADKVNDLKQVTRVDLDLVWDPPWDPERLSPAAKLALNL